MSIENSLKAIHSYFNDQENKVLSVKDGKLTCENKSSVARTTHISVPYSFSARDSIHVDIEINNLSKETAKTITEFVIKSLSTLQTKKPSNLNSLDKRIIEQLQFIKQTTENSDQEPARTASTIGSRFKSFFKSALSSETPPQPVAQADSAYASEGVDIISTHRNKHRLAKEQLQTSLAQTFPEAKVSFVSPAKKPCPKVADVIIKNDLDKAIFTWENTPGVQGDIQKDGKNDKQTVLYGVASQFNGSEAVNPYQVPKGEAVETYKRDPTQGPGAQLQFPDSQVELINNAAFDGFNGLCRVLDEKTIHLVHHGYLIVESEEEASQVIAQLQKDGDKAAYICVGNIPKGEGNTQQVYEMLVAAPAFGRSYIVIAQLQKNNKTRYSFFAHFLPIEPSSNKLSLWQVHQKNQ